MAKWRKGESGNPAGRKPGSGEVCKLRAQLKPHLEAVVNALVERAKDGDVPAIKLLLERVIPPHKPTSEPVRIRALASAERLSDKATAILAAIAAGELSPDIGASLLAALGNVAKAVEIDELMRRIEALENETH